MYLVAASSSVDRAVESSLLAASFLLAQFDPWRHAEAFYLTQYTTFLTSLLSALDALASVFSLARPFVGRREQLR